MKIYEKDVVDQIIKYLQSLGIKDIETEVQAFSSFVDIVYIDERHQFVCLEVKLTDWRTVIEQAKKLQKFTNQVYVVMPVPETYYRRTKIRQEIEPTGIGLYWFKDGQLLQEFSAKGYEAMFGLKKWKSMEYDYKYLRSHLAESFYINLCFHFLARCIDYYKQKKDKKGHAFLF